MSCEDGLQTSTQNFRVCLAELVIARRRDLTINKPHARFLG